MATMADPTLMNLAMAHRIERTWARREVEFAEHFVKVAPEWGTRVLGFADGVAVLAGRGLFVNRAFGMGFEGAVTEADFARLEVEATAMGLPAAVQFGPYADPAVRGLATKRSYGLSGIRSILALKLEDFEVRSSDEACGFIIETVKGTSGLDTWRKLAREAFGCTEGVAAMASDLYIETSFALATEIGFIARDTKDGRALGCAALAVTKRVDGERDGLMATLGAMGTLPTARRLGVQAALIRHRLEVARAMGCDVATTSANAATTSERNLVRCGFNMLYAQVTLMRSA